MLKGELKSELCNIWKKETTKQYPFSANSFKKYKVKTNLNMCILMYFKIQSDQSRITRNVLKSQIFDLFT